MHTTNDQESDEVVVLVDEYDQIIGTALKSEVHNSTTSLHRGFSVFLFNRKGELLLQRRALTKKTWPGIWSNSCCGHPMPNEKTEDSAARRLEFELGLTGIDLTIAIPDFRYRAEKDGVVENEICPVLIGFTDAFPVPNPVEVADVKWIDWQACVLSLEDPESEISPWAAQEARLLAESIEFREHFAARTSQSPVR